MCCHHLCTWKDFIGRDILKHYSVTLKNFYLIRRLCTYYTMNSKQNKRRKKKMLKKKNKIQKRTEQGRLAELRHELGLKCKRLLNECRCQTLQRDQRWKNVRLIQYGKMRFFYIFL